MKITIIGTGYVGLVSGVCFAKIGHKVTCVDNNLQKIADLKRDIAPIYEPGLNELIGQVKENISFSTNLSEALDGCDAAFIAVGTPQGDDGKANLDYVFDVAGQIASLAKNYLLIVTKSTVPIGTNLKIKQLIKKNNPDLDFDIASNPEFLREGFALDDFLNANRIVVGVENQRASQIIEQIYEPLTVKNIPLVISDIVTAETIKYAANCFLSCKIGFINQMADLCEKMGGNIKTLSKGLGLDQRIGSAFLNAGPGFGGSCFPKDINALLNIADENEVDLSIIDAANKANLKRFDDISLKISDLIGQKKVKKIAFLGLAFKGGTDDVRFSPAIKILQKIADLDVKINAFDPKAIENSKPQLSAKNIQFTSDEYDCCTDADLIIIATEWQDFKVLDWKKIKNLNQGNLIYDLRNILDEKQMADLGFDYYFIGKKN